MDPLLYELSTNTDVSYIKQTVSESQDLERGNAASCARDDLTLQYLPFHEPLGQAWLDQHLPTEIGRLSAR